MEGWEERVCGFDSIALEHDTATSSSMSLPESYVCLSSSAYLIVSRRQLLTKSLYMYDCSHIFRPEKVL